MRAANPTTAEALNASVALARRLGVQGHEALIIADGYSLRVRIGPIVTRVMTAGVALRGDALPWLQREVAVAQRLSAQHAGVVPPWQAVPSSAVAPVRCTPFSAAAPSNCRCWSARKPTLRRHCATPTMRSAPCRAGAVTEDRALADAAAADPGIVDATRLADCRDLRRLQTLASLLLREGSTSADPEPLSTELAKRY